MYVYIQSTDTCFAVLQLVSVAWHNLDMAYIRSSRCIYIYIYIYYKIYQL